MREQTFRIHTDRLLALSKIHKPTDIARILGISKQRWRNYETGVNDVPAGILRLLCASFGIAKNELIRGE